MKHSNWEFLHFAVMNSSMLHLSVSILFEEHSVDEGRVMSGHDRSWEATQERKEPIIYLELRAAEQVTILWGVAVSQSVMCAYAWMEMHMHGGLRGKTWRQRKRKSSRVASRVWSTVSVCLSLPIRRQMWRALIAWGTPGKCWTTPTCCCNTEQTSKLPAHWSKEAGHHRSDEKVGRRARLDANTLRWGHVIAWNVAD